METLLEWIDNCDLSRLSEYLQCMQNVNSTLVFDEECDLSLLHVLSGYESPYRDKAVRCLFETKLESSKPKLDPNRKSGIGNDRWTAAHICAVWGHYTTLKLLLEHGANPRIKDQNGYDVLEIARAFDNFLCVNVLQQFLYDKNRQNAAPTPSAPIDSEETKELPITKSSSCQDADNTQSQYFTCSYSESARELTLEQEEQQSNSLPSPKLFNNYPKFSDQSTQVSDHSLETPVKPFDISLLCQSLNLDNNITMRRKRRSASNTDIDRVKKNLLKRMEALEIDEKNEPKAEQVTLTDTDEKISVEVAATSSSPELSKSPTDLNKLVSADLMTDDESDQTSSFNEKTFVSSSNDFASRKPGIIQINADVQKPFVLTSDGEEKQSTYFLIDNHSASNNLTGDEQNQSAYIRKSLISENADRSVELYEDRQFGVALLNESIKSNLNYRPSLRRPIAISDQNNDQVVSPNADFRLAEDEFMQMKDWELRTKLIENGLSPGPINSSTKGVYVKKLRILMQRNARLDSPLLDQSNRKGSPAQFAQPQFSSELNLLLCRKFDFAKAKLLEQEFQEYFERTNSSKVYFTYLLLDPRITQNLVDKAKYNEQSNVKLFEQFIRSIFYIGKGQGNRPFMHLYEAALLNTRTPFKKAAEPSNKLSRILDIWSSGQGVISLHCFHSISSPEALTRECFMINTIGIQNLTNIQIGQNRLRNMLWTDHKKNYFGAYLLYKAFNLLLVNGERQIRKADVQR